MEILFDEVKKAGNGVIDRERVKARAEQNRRRFYELPLEEMGRRVHRPLPELLNEAAAIIEGLEF